MLLVLQLLVYELLLLPEFFRTIDSILFLLVSRVDIFVDLLNFSIQRNLVTETLKLELVIVQRLLLLL